VQEWLRNHGADEEVLGADRDVSVGHGGRLPLDDSQFAALAAGLALGAGIGSSNASLWGGRWRAVLPRVHGEAVLRSARRRDGVGIGKEERAGRADTGGRGSGNEVPAGNRAV